MAGTTTRTQPQRCYATGGGGTGRLHAAQPNQDQRNFSPTNDSVSWEGMAVGNKKTTTLFFSSGLLRPHQKTAIRRLHQQDLTGPSAHESHQPAGCTCLPKYARESVLRRPPRGSDELTSTESPCSPTYWPPAHLRHRVNHVHYQRHLPPATRRFPSAQATTPIRARDFHHRQPPSSTHL